MEDMPMESYSMKNSMQQLKNEHEMVHGGMYKHTDVRHDRNGVEIKIKRDR